MKSNRFWGILIVIVLAFSLLGAFLTLNGKTVSGSAAVYQNGKLLHTIDLSKVNNPYTFTVDGPAGVNTIQVEPGRIRVSQADCPDQICVKQGWISNGVVPIVCLPNGLVIQINTDTEPDVDGVAG